MNDIKRVFLIVLDSLGIGEAPDAAEFGDRGSNTLHAIRKSKYFHIPHLEQLGLLNIDGVDSEKRNKDFSAAICRLSERSKGKDTIIGHWEIAGITSEKAMPTFPNGFPPEFINDFEQRTGRKTLCNMPFSGTDVIKIYGERHIRTGELIVYTSADSVFQIAAHEDVVPLHQLYEYCELARKMLIGDLAVGRVIARPFVGIEGHFTRTVNRHDYALQPPKKTMLNYISERGLDVIAIGKIHDIFNGSGITQSVKTKGNADGMKQISDMAKQSFEGLCFINLVDFDMLYGHRNDVDGYANAMSEFDRWLGGFLNEMGDSDVLMITADHGCDPSMPGTDHSREDTPLIIYGKGTRSHNFKTKSGFYHIAKTILDMLAVDNRIEGESFYDKFKS